MVRLDNARSRPTCDKLKKMFISKHLGKKRIRRNLLGLRNVFQDKQEVLRNHTSRFNDRLVQLTDVSDKVDT